MKHLLFFSFILILLSCSNTYNEYQSVNDLKWYKNDIKTFDVSIEKSGEYDLFFEFRHVTGYPFKQINIEITHISPSRKEYFTEREIPVADNQNNYIGEVAGQLWDIESLISEKTFLEKGQHSFKISHLMSSDPVILVVDIGLKIKKAN